MDPPVLVFNVCPCFLPQKEKREKRERAPKSEKGSTRRKRGSKKDRDPSQPKRAQSAYFLWLNDHRSQIKEENPGISITDISKKAGEMWKKIEADEKAVKYLCLLGPFGMISSSSGNQTIATLSFTGSVRGLESL